MKKEAGPFSETLLYASNAKSRNSVLISVKPIECIQMDIIEYLGSEKASLLTAKLGM
jgi:ABC-type Zn2+ transport system substrate-binding protein/surface adhesin